MRDAGPAKEGATEPETNPISAIEFELRCNFSGTLCQICGITAPVSRRVVNERSSEREILAKILRCCNAATTIRQFLSVRHEPFCDLVHAHAARSKKRTAESRTARTGSSAPAVRGGMLCSRFRHEPEFFSGLNPSVAQMPEIICKNKRKCFSQSTAASRCGSPTLATSLSREWGRDDLGWISNAPVRSGRPGTRG